MAKGSSYRGRLAPSPTGYLHLGHARTFWIAWQRARAAHGKLIFRNEDLDYQRCKPEFVRAMHEDLRWLGLDWDEGPDIGGSLGPYSQSERRSFYLDAWRKLRDSGLIYPCTCSRKDLERALSAPHEEPTQHTCGPQPPPAASSADNPSSPQKANNGEAHAPSPAISMDSSTQPGAAAVHSPDSSHPSLERLRSNPLHPTTKLPTPEPAAKKSGPPKPTIRPQE